MRIAGALLLLALFASSTVHGQSAGGGANRLALDLGVSASDERDAGISPLRYHGSGLDIALAYAYESAHTRTELAMSGASHGILRDRDAMLASGGDQHRVGLYLLHMRRIADVPRHHTRVFGGLSLGTTATRRTQQYLFFAPGEYTTQVTVAGPVVQLEYSPAADRTFTYRLGAPLVCGVQRPYAPGQANGDTKWSGPAGCRALAQRVTYTVALAPHLGFRSTLALDVMNLPRDPVIVGQYGALSAGLIWWTRGAPAAARR